MTRELSYLIGVDGGGTGCRVRLENTEGQILAETRGGPANVTSDFVTALGNIMATVTAAYEQAGLEPERHHDDVAWLGLAGAATGDSAARLTRALGFAHARVTTDCVTGVEGALGRSDGLVAMLGTGSFFVRRVGGQDRRIGGWGYQLGDEAGGAWLGRALLMRVLQAHDGLVPRSPLTDATLARFGGADAIVSFAQNATPGDIARLAQDVAGAEGDATAEAILSEAVVLITDRLDAVGPGAGPFCLLGGLAAVYGPRLPQRYRDRLTPPRGNALSGALSLARRTLLATEATP